jgi:hypothetical protein
VLIGFGLLTSIANSRATTDVEHLEVQAVMRDGGRGWTHRAAGDRSRRFGALFFFVCSGLALVAVGLVLAALG